MLKNKLKQSQVFKNQRDLCEFMDWEVKDSTNSRKAQLKELERHCKFHKEGRKIIIDEVYETPKEKQDRRKENGGNNTSPETKLLYKNVMQNIPKNLYECAGVYKLQIGNKIYIGSTIRSFFGRICGHRYHNGETYQMMKDGAKLEILWIAQDGDCEDRIRLMEEKYIRIFSSKPGYNIVNKQYKTIVQKSESNLNTKYNKLCRVRDSKLKDISKLYDRIERYVTEINRIDDEIEKIQEFIG